MNLKKLFAVEIAVGLVVVIAILWVVEVNPYLLSSKSSNQIGMYNEKTYVVGNVTLGLGQQASAQFNYSIYDPAILVIDLKFQDWQSPGDLSVYCNGRVIATLQATPSNPTTRMVTISVSGWDWVKPPTIDAYTYGNEVTFSSDPETGYQGTFSYQINIRGSR